ncbi:MAG TPA: fumarylacetoacetate hydrolase family protein [Ilumatobacter sp.]|nr:fumarylacetoacetate hydrolase family protein [Ilumatobacter sp.]
MALRLATIRTDDGTRAVRLDADAAVETGHADVGELLTDPQWRELVADGPRHDLGSLDFATLVTQPEKVICVGLNYKDHIAEMGNQQPEYPPLFPKYARTLTGAYDDIELPPESTKVDWEAELTIVIGAPIRRATADQAAAAIAGYTVANDVSMRDYQRHTSQFLAGKAWERTTPVGPWLTVPDEPIGDTAYPIGTTIDGEVLQASNTDQLLFGPVALVEYISKVITLVPGDLILTGTPGGVGAGRTPPRFVQPGETVVVTVDGLGELRNRFTSP